MHPVRKGDIHSINPGLVEKLVIRAIRLRDTVLLRVVLGLLEVSRGNSRYYDAAMAHSWANDGGRIDHYGREDADTEGVRGLRLFMTLLIYVLLKESREL